MLCFAILLTVPVRFVLKGKPTVHASKQSLVEVLRDNDEDTLMFRFFDRSQESLIFNADELIDGIEVLIAEMNQSIAEADEFIAAMGAG